MDDTSTHDQPLSLLLATWFERRLHATTTFTHCARRFYGLELVDPEHLDHDDPQSARVTFVGTDVLPIDLAPFDAFAIVETEWREVVSGHPRRPLEFPQRRRARVVTVAMLGTLATVVRFEHEPELVVCSVAA